MRAFVPLYAQIEFSLRERLSSGWIAPGQRFPTDEQLCREFEVSRATVRSAVDALHRDGLITRVPGRGTFVNNATDRENVLRFSGSIEGILTQGDGAGTSHLIMGRERVLPTRAEAELLKLPKQQLVVRFTGFRQRNDVRLGRIVIAVPESTGARLDVNPGGRYLSISKILSEELGLKPIEIHQVISASLADEGLAEDLGIPLGAPILSVRRTFYGLGRTPLEVATTSYPGDRYQYEIGIT